MTETDPHTIKLTIPGEQALSNGHEMRLQIRNVYKNIYICMRCCSKKWMCTAVEIPSQMLLWMVVHCVWCLVIPQNPEGKWKRERRRVCSLPEATINQQRQQVNGPRDLASDAGFPGGRLLHWTEDPSFRHSSHHVPAESQPGETNEK